MERKGSIQYIYTRQRAVASRPVPDSVTVDESLGVHPIYAVVEEKGGSVYIKVNCPLHGPQNTLISSDAPFFKRWMLSDVSFMPKLQDIEDLKPNLTLEKRKDFLPLSFDLPLFKNDEFLSDEEIKKHIDNIRSSYPTGRQFVMRLSGRLANNIDILNNKILLAHTLLKQGEPILVSVSYERLVLLADLDNSCFLKPRIFPAMKYYLRKDDEQLCLQEMTQLIRVLQEFQGIKAVFSISIETPWPDLRPILALLRSHKGLIKVVEFQLERSPRRMVDTVATAIQQGQNVYSDVVDFAESLRMIAQATDGSIAVDDFFPVSMGRIFEPFLAMAGMGKFSIRPSSFCGFGTVLCSSPVETRDSIYSVPVSRFVDIERFSKDMAPLLPKLEEDGIGWWTGRSIKKIVTKCAKKQLPDIFSYLTDKDKAPLLNKFVDNLQFIVGMLSFLGFFSINHGAHYFVDAVHNHMDVGAADLQRRCKCATLQVDDSALVASCLGCV
jgi:hypothetical protein